MGAGVRPAALRLGVFLLAGSVALLGSRLVLALLPGAIDLGDVPLPTFFVTMTITLLVAHVVTFATVDARGWSVVGVSRGAWGWRKVLVGFGLGALAVGGPSLVLLLSGWLRVESSPSGNWGQAAALTLLALLPAALWEELLTRGYLLTVLREWLGSRRAIVATSALFGALHLENAGATAQSVALVTLAGIFLGSLRVAFDSLPAAWAAHVAWNFVMAALLHTAVSGVGVDSPNYRVVDAGPDWATGGAWGPEAGLVTGVGLLVGIYIMLRRGRRGVDHT
jgi:membrane protease YdiL (CAAX protease family)